MLPASMWLVVVHKMGTHLGLSVLAFNWAGTLIQHKLLWGFQFPQIKASAVSFLQKTGRFPSSTICDVLFVYPYDSIFCELLNCCEEKEKVILRGRPGELLQSGSYAGLLQECRSGHGGEKTWASLTRGAAWWQLRDICAPTRTGHLLLPPCTARFVWLLLCCASPGARGKEVDVTSNHRAWTALWGLTLVEGPSGAGVPIARVTLVLTIFNVKMASGCPSRILLTSSSKMCWGAYNFLLGFWASLRTNSRWRLQILCCNHERQKTSCSEIKEILIW